MRKPVLPASLWEVLCVELEFTQVKEGVYRVSTATVGHTLLSAVASLAS